MSLLVATDGSAYKGVGGAGICFEINDKIYKYHIQLPTMPIDEIWFDGDKLIIESVDATYEPATNNRAEMFAMIVCVMMLYEFDFGAEEATIITDSKEYVLGYLDKIINNKVFYTERNNDLIHLLCNKINTRCVDMEFKWIPAHTAKKKIPKGINGRELRLNRIVDSISKYNFKGDDDTHIFKNGLLTCKN